MMELAHISLSHHIAHATAVLSELTLGLSVACFTKIFLPPPVIDLLSRETTIKRIEELDGGVPALFFKVGCFFGHIFGLFGRKIPFITFLFELLVLFCLAYETSLSEITLFWGSVISFLLIISYVYLNRETLRKTGEKPELDPVE